MAEGDDLAGAKTVLNRQTASLDARVRNLESRLGNLDERVDTMSERVAVLEAMQGFGRALEKQPAPTGANKATLWNSTNGKFAIVSAAVVSLGAIGWSATDIQAFVSSLLGGG